MASHVEGEGEKKIELARMLEGIWDRLKVKWRSLEEKCERWWAKGVPSTWMLLCGVIFVQVGFGLYPVVVRKFASTGAEPLMVAFYQDVGCCPLLFFCAYTVEKKLYFPGIKMILVFMLLGLTGQFASHLLYILGVYWAGPNPANAIQPIVPVWTAILAVVTRTEKFPSPLHVHTWIKLLGILVAVGGAIELTLTAHHDEDCIQDSSNCSSNISGNVSGNGSLEGSSSSSSHHSLSLTLVGYIAIFVGTLSIAVYVLIQKRFIFNSPTNWWKDHPVYVTAYSYLFGALYMALASLYYVVTKQPDKYLLRGTSVYAVIYAIFVTSAIGSLLLTWTNLHLSPTLITAFFPLQVLVTVVASYFIIQEQLAPYQYIGAVIVLVALFMVLFSNHMEERHREGKAVLRVDCKMTRTQQKEEDETTSLIASIKQFPMSGSTSQLAIN